MSSPFRRPEETAVLDGSDEAEAVSEVADDIESEEETVKRNPPAVRYFFRIC